MHKRVKCKCYIFIRVIKKNTENIPAYKMTSAKFVKFMVTLCVMYIMWCNRRIFGLHVYAKRTEYELGMSREVGCIF